MIPWLLIFSRAGIDIACAIVGLAFLCHSCRSGTFGWLNDPILRIGLMAWIWLMTTSAFSHAPLVSLGAALVWVRYLIFYAALRYWVLTRAPALRLLGDVLAAMLMLVALDTLWQYVFNVSLTGNEIASGGRLSGPFSAVKVGIFMAKLLLPAFILMLCFGRSPAAPASRILQTLIIIGGGGVVLLSGERTAFVSLALGVALMGIVAIWADREKRKDYMVMLALYLTAMGLLFLTQPWVQQRTTELFNIVHHYRESPYGQLHIASYELGKSHWLTGVGLKNFRSHCPVLEEQNLVHYCDNHPHNAYLEWFSESGIIGLGLFVGLIAAFMRDAIRGMRRGTAALPAAAAMATLLVHFFPFMPTQSFFSNWPAQLLWYSLSVVFAVMHAQNPPLPSSAFEVAPAPGQNPLPA